MQPSIRKADYHYLMLALKFAGLGIAMGNAQEPVKKAANYITLSNEEDGVAEAIDKFCNQQ